MEPISIVEAADVLQAKVCGSLEDRQIISISTDTRRGARGALFFALRGENADGHWYVAQAFQQGAVGAVVEREIVGAGAPQLVVSDTLWAFGALARWYRRRFDIPVVGVTGSVGKTSTKEMIACALRARNFTLASEQNFNNEIGVPHTLFALECAHQAVVLEMAMRGVGQIARLAEIARPTVGVITNIGLSHIELLGSRQAIASAKAELLESLPAGGTAILPADDEHFAFLRDRCPCAIISFGITKAADFRATDITFSDEGAPRFRVNGVAFALRAAGVHHVINATAACATAVALGVSLEEVAAQLETYHAPPMRMEVLTTFDDVTVLNDTYNAAPDSMRAALETLDLLASTRGRRAVAVLGDMKELGDFSREAHRYVGEIARGSHIDLLVAVGKEAEEIGHAFGGKNIRVFPDTDSAIEELNHLVQRGDIVLVKGSRAMGMERLVEAIQNRMVR
jgi:UDP-N-acetylmuramoyl-tripeptide--D-alanyl-D-alanine ligase